MKLKSIGLKIDLQINSYAGNVINKEDYIVVHTPSNPNYWFGNYIVFKNPPQTSDFKRWCNIFINEIHNKNNSNHMLFSWDTIIGDKGDLSEFVKNDFKVDENVLLSTNEVNKPIHYTNTIDVKALKSEFDWEKTLNNQILCRDENTGESLSGYTDFKKKQMNVYRIMSQKGLCEWYGAFIKNTLVADMGIFFTDGIAYFQDVCTAPEFRRQGICGTSVYKISKMLLESKKVTHITMTADENYHAARIYESVGFKQSEKFISLLNSQYFLNNSKI